ncbi:RING finger protein 207-like [Saccostrea cucullata]|uniref:RING finger protein 207-like n=1 Tax=Saccostrea cuccullata TaxID=36930 RepID=UPI002ED42C87
MENELIEVDLPHSNLDWESVSDEELAFDAQDVLRCTYCEIEIATHFCRTCTDELCLSCRKFHLKSKVPSGHEIVTIKEKHEDGTTIEKCLIHENNIYFACCVECKLPVCTECMKTKHNGHPIVDISQMWNEEKEKVEQSISKLKERIPTDQFALSSAREGMFQIEKWFEKRREEYKKEGEILKEKVDELVMKNIERSKEDERQQKRIFEEIEEENEIALRDLISKYEDQISNGHPAELLVFLKGHVLNPRKTDIFPRIQALNVKDVCTLNLQHQPESACCAESIIKIKTSPLNETEWIKIGYLDDNEEKYHGKGNILVVASIVIGTSHSCAAMSFLHDFKRNPLKISYVFSIANTVLHIKNGDITYAEEEEEIEHIENDRKEVLNCSFLKMKITASLLKHSTMEVKDGSTIHFSTFYTKIVKFWRNRVLSYLEDRNTTIKENEILWVLSLPPPWDSTSEKLLLDYLDQVMHDIIEIESVSKGNSSN